MSPVRGMLVKCQSDDDDDDDDDDDECTERTEACLLILEACNVWESFYARVVMVNIFEKTIFKDISFLFIYLLFSLKLAYPLKPSYSLPVLCFNFVLSSLAVNTIIATFN